MTAGPRGAGVLAFPHAFSRDKRGVWVAPPAARHGPVRARVGAHRAARQLLGARDLSVLSPELRGVPADGHGHARLSPRPANLVRPLALRPGLRVLEVGARHGVLTRYLGESGARVIAVESDDARAAVAAARVRDLPGVAVVTAPLADIEFSGSFDLILLVDQLQGAPARDAGAPADAQRLVARCARLLAPAGVLAIAADNSLGLARVGGPAGLTAGRVCPGTAGRPGSRPGAFTSEQLRGLIAAAGLSWQEMLTPLPDHTAVKSVVRFAAVPDRARESLAHLVASSLCEDPRAPRAPAFSLEQFAAEAVRNRLGEALGSSLFALASRTVDGVRSLLPDGPFAWHYAVDRDPAYAKATVLEAAGAKIWVRRAPLRGGPAGGRGTLTQRLTDERFCEGESAWLGLVARVNQPGWSVAEAAGSLAPWGRKLAATARVRRGAVVTPGDLVDLSPFNVMFDGDKVSVFDQEWQWHEDVPLPWVALRGAVFSLAMITSFAEPGSGVPLEVGPLAERICAELLRDSPPAGQVWEGFWDWLATLQASADGVGVAAARSGLASLWRRRIAVRGRRPGRRTVRGLIAGRVGRSR